ncbi:MAG: phosphatidate cytidylyltransferase [Desulfatirhabdiaceae bacterium]
MTHLKRWITGLAALPILIWVISYSGVIGLSVVVALVSILALIEYFHITLKDSCVSVRLLLTVPGYAVGIFLITASHIQNPWITAMALMGNLVFVGAVSLYGYSRDPLMNSRAAMQIQGMVYIPLMLSSIVLIRSGQDGTIWIYFLLAVVFSGDIGALYVGTFLGKHKLCPSISPKKTIEGALGGLAANLMIGLTVKAFFLPTLSWGYTILLILLIGIAGQIGDLFESVLKRTAGIKDSGGILPGHGGMLDRIDALLFAGPVAWIFQSLLS